MMRKILTLAFALCASPVAAQTFDTIGWPHGISGPSSWYNVQTWAPNRFALAAPPSPRWGVGQVARVTVDPGDKVGGWSGERSEVATMRDAAGAAIVEQPGTTQFYAFSVYVPTDWQAPQIDPACTCAWGIVLQLHGPDAWTGSPAFALTLDSHFGAALNAGDLVKLGPFHGVNYALSDGSLNAGHWTDFIIGIGFATDATGSLTIWRRNEGASQFSQVLAVSKVATLQTNASVPTKTTHYWKQGFYRSTSPAVTSTLWLTGLVRAPDFATAAYAAFGG